MNSVSSVTLAAFQSSGCSFMYLMMSCCRYITYGFLPDAFQSFALPVLECPVLNSQDPREGVPGQHICVRHESSDTGPLPFKKDRIFRPVQLPGYRGERICFC